MKEYKIAKGWAIFIYISAPLLIALFGFLLLMPFIPGIKPGPSPNAYWYLAPVSIGMIVLIILGLIDTVKSKFVISEKEIYFTGVFSNRHLLLSEIKGYRIAAKYIIVESRIDDKKNVHISTHTRDSYEIVDWLANSYPDLDKINAEEETQEILANEAFGWNSEERMAKLNRVRTITKILNWTGGLIGAWTLFWPRPYEFAIIASIAMTLIAILLFNYFKGLIRIDEKKESAYPSVFTAVFASSMGLFLRALLDYHIFSYKNLWAPSSLISLIFLAVLLIGNKEFKLKSPKDYITIFGIALITFSFGYGSVVTLNCFYDKSVPEAFKAKILHKRINTSKTTTYYFELSPWGQQAEPDEVSVSRKLYNKLQVDTEVKIYLKKGQFKIPWFVITE